MNGLCIAYVRLKQSEQGVSFCSKADTYVALSEGYFHLNQDQEAAASAQKAIELSPNSSPGYAGLGFILYQMKNQRRLKKFLREPWHSTPRPRVTTWR